MPNNFTPSVLEDRSLPGQHKLYSEVLCQVKHVLCLDLSDLSRHADNCFSLRHLGQDGSWEVGCSDH